MKNKTQLIAYADRLGNGGFAEFTRILNGPLRGIFGGVHILPFFNPIDGDDAGFDPIDHRSVDPALGDWEDLLGLSEDYDLIADLIVNHISSRSFEFQDLLKRGPQSEHSSMFLRYLDVFPGGATDAELLKLDHPGRSLPFTRRLSRNW